MKTLVSSSILRPSDTATAARRPWDIGEQEQQPGGIERSRLERGEERDPRRLVGVPEGEGERAQPLRLEAVARENEVEEIAGDERDVLRGDGDACIPDDEGA